MSAVKFNLTTQQYRNVPAPAPVGISKWIKRVFTGAELKATINGVTPVATDTNTYKWAEIGLKQIVKEVVTIVTDADDTSITIAIGHDDGVTATTNSLEGSVNLNAQGITSSADDIVLFGIKGFLTFTISTLTALDDATEFVLLAHVIDIYDSGFEEALTTTI